MVYIEHTLTLDGKTLTCPEAKIVINKYSNQTEKLKFVYDKTKYADARPYFGMLNPITNKYKFTPIINDELIITSEYTAYPGLWRSILTLVEDGYVIDESGDLDNTKVIFVSDEYKRIVVRDNFFDEDAIELNASPAIDEMLELLRDSIDAIENAAIACEEIEENVEGMKAEITTMYTYIQTTYADILRAETNITELVAQATTIYNNVVALETSARTYAQNASNSASIATAQATAATTANAHAQQALADITTKQTDVTANATQVAEDKATVKAYKDAVEDIYYTESDITLCTDENIPYAPAGGLKLENLQDGDIVTIYINFAQAGQGVSVPTVYLSNDKEYAVLPAQTPTTITDTFTFTKVGDVDYLYVRKSPMRSTLATITASVHRNGTIIDTINESVDEATEQAENASTSATSAQTSETNAKAVETNLKNFITLVDESETVNIPEIKDNEINTTDTWSSSKIASSLSSIPKFNVKVVTALPTEDISTTTIYLVRNDETEGGNIYTEYIYVNNTWEILGSKAVDTPFLNGTGDYSAIQQSDMANVASGKYAIAMGCDSLAQGVGSFARGQGAKAYGICSTSIGINPYYFFMNKMLGSYPASFGNSSLALGNGVAIGDFSIAHALSGGEKSVSLNAGKAYGSYSLAQGQSIAGGNTSSSFGFETIASRMYQFVDGKFNIPDNNTQTTHGEYHTYLVVSISPNQSISKLTIPSYDYVTKINKLTVFNKNGSTIMDSSKYSYNATTQEITFSEPFTETTIVYITGDGIGGNILGKYAEIVGNGTDDTHRSNARTLDWSGNAWFAGDVTATDTDGTSVSLIEVSKKASSDVILTSPNGSKFKLNVDDDGVLITTLIEED